VEKSTVFCEQVINNLLSYQTTVRFFVQFGCYTELTKQKGGQTYEHFRNHRIRRLLWRIFRGGLLDGKAQGEEDRPSISGITVAKIVNLKLKSVWQDGALNVIL